MQGCNSEVCMFHVFGATGVAPFFTRASLGQLGGPDLPRGERGDVVESNKHLPFIGVRRDEHAELAAVDFFHLCDERVGVRVYRYAELLRSAVAC